MKCPIDTTELQMTERQGVEIDYCPKCRGVWLDRGELDKIINRAEEGGEGADTLGASPSKTRRNPQQDNEQDGGGLLSQLFDF